ARNHRRRAHGTQDDVCNFSESGTGTGLADGSSRQRLAPVGGLVPGQRVCLAFMSKTAIIAAMEREVRPLIRSWKVSTNVRTLEHGGRRYRLFENGEATLICGGIGAEAARRSTETVIREVNPVRVISVGFAGALDASRQVGHVFEPRTVINAADGVRTECGAGEGILVSSATVAGKEQKIRF